MNKSKITSRYSVDVNKYIGFNIGKAHYKSLKSIIELSKETNEKIEKSRILKWFYQIACLNTADLDQLNFNPR